MKCHEFEDRLHSLLDDRQSPEADAQLVSHAANCEPCRHLLTGQRLLLAGLRRGVAQRPSGQLAQRVVARHVVACHEAEPIEAVVLDGSSASRRVWRVLAWVAATAAAVAIAVTIYLSSQPDQPNVAVSLPAVESVRPVGPSQPDRNPDHGIVQHDSRPRSGNGRRAPSLGAFQLLPRGGYGVTLADMATSSLPEAVERMEEVERYAPGIRPIRVSFSMLWNALWRTIPGFGSSESDPQARHSRTDVRRLV
jgi:hypothetical protein